MELKVEEFATSFEGSQAKEACSQSGNPPSRYLGTTVKM
jgi:hypothetical protein